MKNLKILFLALTLICHTGINAQNDTTKISGLFYLDEKPVTISISDGKIAKIERISTGVDSSKVYIGPGLIDIQINGYMGVDFSDQNLTVDQMKTATKALWKEGVTSFYPTVITNNQKGLKKSFLNLSDALMDDEIGISMPGLHLEGPYISPVQGYRGAHLEKYIRQPDWNEFMELQHASINRIKLITLAPEMPGAIPFIKKCRETGVVVALGHHNASSEIITQAVEAGARLSTHLGNGCANMIDRHNNPLWPQLVNDSLNASIITDGFHLTKDQIQCFYKMKGVDKTILVSDALDLAGLPPGQYVRGERTVILTKDVIQFPVEDVLAGAASPLSADVSNIMKFTHCTLGDAFRMGSTNPARLMGLSHLGEISQGKRADLILFTIEKGRIVIQRTIVAGKTVYTK